MGNITKKVIKKLLKDVRDDLEEAIAVEGEKQSIAGQTIIDVDTNIQISEVPPPQPINLDKGAPITFTTCIWICYTIDGVRVCKKYCY